MVKKLTVEELLDLEEELHDKKEAEEDGALYQLVSVYEALHRKISADPDSEYTSSLPSIKSKLIYYLVRYGTYLKTVYRKDDIAAQDSLKKAIRYERSLPIAHYRLGFLSYKRRKYTLALHYFQDSIRYQQSTDNLEYKMNDQQIYHCHLYLANCGLFIAAEAQDSLEQLEQELHVESALRYEVSPYDQQIRGNDEHLAAQACQFITREGKRYGSLEECGQNRELENTIILDVTGRKSLLIFNGKEIELKPNPTEMLGLFLISSTEKTPITKHDVYDLRSKSTSNGEMPTNTFTQNVSRLRAKLREAEIEEPVIKNTTFQGNTAYFYTHHLPYLIMQRSDESFILA